MQIDLSCMSHVTYVTREFETFSLTVPTGHHQHADVVVFLLKLSVTWFCVRGCLLY